MNRSIKLVITCAALISLAAIPQNSAATQQNASRNVRPRAVATAHVPYVRTVHKSATLLILESPEDGIYI